VTDGLHVEILDDPAAVAQRAADVVAEHARLAIAERGEFTFAVSGGHTPAAMFLALAGHGFPWDNTTIFQVDERIAPAGSPERNLTLLHNSLPASALSHVHPMPVENTDLEDAAARYSRSLPNRFDLIHLGIGPDGHTASLVPGDPVLSISERDVAITQPYMGLRRMTITYPVIDRARALLWLVVGAEKADALRRLREHDDSIPAGRVAADRALVLADADAGDQAGSG
jgi:6-phosphogluconolactonase